MPSWYFRFHRGVSVSSVSFPTTVFSPSVGQVSNCMIHLILVVNVHKLTVGVGIKLSAWELKSDVPEITFLANSSHKIKLINTLHSIVANIFFDFTCIFLLTNTKFLFPTTRRVTDAPSPHLVPRSTDDIWDHPTLLPAPAHDLSPL